MPHVARRVFVVAAAGAAVFCVGTRGHARSRWPALAALAELVERTLQILINTLSFARVGAFALAHAGLSSAIVALMTRPRAASSQGVVLVVGNVVVLVLEGLVVSIQTTRLVLFEFFTRFLVAAGPGVPSAAGSPFPLAGVFNEILLPLPARRSPAVALCHGARRHRAPRRRAAGAGGRPRPSAAWARKRGATGCWPPRISTALAALGAGFAVAKVGTAAIGALAEKPELFGRLLIFVGLAEGIAIYGLIVSILILNRLA